MLRRLLCSALLLTLSAALAAAQASAGPPPSAPLPFQTGLWQWKVTVSLDVFPNTPTASALPNGPHTSLSQTCMTSNSLKKGMQMMQSNRNQKCTLSHFHQDSRHLSFEQECAGPDQTTTAHVDFLFENDKEMHGSAAVKFTGPHFPQGFTMNSAIESKFLSSDCGAVQPGEDKVLQP